MANKNNLQTILIIILLGIILVLLCIILYKPAPAPEKPTPPIQNTPTSNPYNPEPKTNTQPSIGALRYNIKSETTEYFKAGQYFPLKRGLDITFENFTINENYFKEDVSRFFFDNRNPDILWIDLDQDAKDEILSHYQTDSVTARCFPDELKLRVEYLEHETSPGTINMEIKNADGNQQISFGKFKFGLDNSLVIQKVYFDDPVYCVGPKFGAQEHMSPLSATYKTIAPEVIEWRDSVLKKPLALRYMNNKGKWSAEPLYICAIKTDSHALVFDLSKNTTKDSACIK